MDLYVAPAHPNGEDTDNTLLFKIARQVDSRIALGGVPVSPAAGVARTLTTTAAVASGSVAVGAKSIVFSSSSDWAGTIAGAAFPASTTVTVNAPFGDTLAAIAFTRSAGTLNIFRLA